VTPLANVPKVIIVVGRGHGGTRLISRLLLESGVATGNVNYARDMVPPTHMHAAADIYTRLVGYRGDCEWDFSRANAAEIPTDYQQSVDQYLEQIQDVSEPKYFKLPETILSYPWIKQMFPDATYIHWVRDPRDAEVHNSDRREMWDEWGIDRQALSEQLVAAMSWKYQYDIVKSVPPPQRFIRVRYEDFCLDHRRQVERLSEFVELRLEPLADVRPDAVYKWTRQEGHETFDFLEPAIAELGYDELPAGYG
jgi:sulfotransferase family protein